MQGIEERVEHKKKDHETWNEDMAIRHNPDDFITRTGFIVRWMESLRIRKSINILNCQPHDRVLDLGCGSGNLTKQLVGKTVVGVDLSDFLLKLAKDRCAPYPHIKIQKGNAESIEFEDSYFQKLICSEVLEHVQDPSKVLAEMHRVVSPGGTVVITVPNEDLINMTKKYVLKLGLKKWVAGQYNMSDNMLDEWHVSEITNQWVKDHIGNEFKLRKSLAIPFGIFPYHRAFVLTVQK